MTVPSTDVASMPADSVILDVREDDEWSAGHIDGALHVPMGQVPGRLGELPADRDVVVVCRSGGRSARVTAFLRQNGTLATNLSGGMQDWAAAGRPMISEGGQPPEVI